VRTKEATAVNLPVPRATATAGKPLRESQEGSVIVIVMVFVLVFLILGLSLYWLNTAQTRSTELERTDVKAFNVAEAGVDAAMLNLKLDWPDSAGEDATLTSAELAALRTQVGAGTNGLWFSSRLAQAEAVSQFIQVAVYDNHDSRDSAHPKSVVSVPPDPAYRLYSDSNADGKMFVDASSNVDNDRHRILVQVERQRYPVNLPGYGLLANIISSNGQGLEIGIEDGTSCLVGTTVNPQGKGIDYDPTKVTLNVGPSYSFDNYITEQVKVALCQAAKSQESYFDSTNGGASAANDLLASGNANGKVVYVKSTTGGVTVGGNSQIGTVAKPVVVVIDTPDGSSNDWDMKGNADFYGVVIVLGNAMLRGTCSIHGAVYCRGTVENKGNGSSGEIYYNQTIIYNINHMCVISVNIVTNTWEEYTK
jgi:hypothetical protein